MNKPDILLCNLWQNYCISLRIDGCGRVAVHVRLLIFLEERGWEKGMIRLAYHRNESNRLSKDHGYPPQMNIVSQEDNELYDKYRIVEIINGD